MREDMRSLGGSDDPSTGLRLLDERCEQTVSGMLAPRQELNLELQVQERRN